MGGRNRRRALVAACVAIAGCLASSAPAATQEKPAPPPTPPDTATIRSLPGYRAEHVEMRSFTGKAYVIEAGTADGPPVVLVHGISSTGAHDWDDVLPVLARTRRVIAFDLPGFGRSAKPQSPFTPETYANLVEELVEARVDGSYDLVAHSMGVSVALEVVRRQPDRVRRLVLASGAALLHGQALSLEGIRDAQESWGPFGGLLSGVRNGAYNMMGKLPDRYVHYLATGVSTDDVGRSVAAGVISHDSGAALDAVRSPTLVVFGRHDEVATEREQWALASRIPGAHIAFIRGAGHNPMRETPSIFNDLVVKWLSGKPAGQAIAPPDTTSTRDAVCRKNRGVTEFRGAYRKIQIEHCDEVTLEGVRAQEIELVHSQATGKDVVVVGDQVAVSLFASNLTVSGGTFQAAVPMRMKKSRVDLAGVTFRGEEFAVQAIGDAKVLCSLCRMDVDQLEGRLHGFYALEAGKTLTPKLALR